MNRTVGVFLLGVSLGVTFFLGLGQWASRSETEVRREADESIRRLEAADSPVPPRRRPHSNIVNSNPGPVSFFSPLSKDARASIRERIATAARSFDEVDFYDPTALSASIVPLEREVEAIRRIVADETGRELDPTVDDGKLDREIAAALRDGTIQQDEVALFREALATRDRVTTLSREMSAAEEFEFMNSISILKPESESEE